MYIKTIAGFRSLEISLEELSLGTGGKPDGAEVSSCGKKSREKMCHRESKFILS